MYHVILRTKREPCILPRDQPKIAPLENTIGGRRTKLAPLHKTPAKWFNQ